MTDVVGMCSMSVKTVDYVYYVGREISASEKCLRRTGLRRATFPLVARRAAMAATAAAAATGADTGSPRPCRRSGSSRRAPP